MKIIIDDKIPFVKGVFEPFAEVQYVAGSATDASVLKDADAVITRTRTKCNAETLKGSKVKFIATATIGYDHIDANYCAKNDIEWTSAPGCNADAVVQYVFSALAHLGEAKGLDTRDKVIGIVGVGNVGSRIAKFAERLGMKVLKNDPPREELEGGDEFVSLDTIKSEADIITFHTPLTTDGPYPTHHLFNDEFLNKCNKRPIIINASRGGVCSNIALKKASQNKSVEALVIDCWENEPAIDLDLLAMVEIGTFHIAGYSLEGKANATTAAVRAVSRFFALGFDDWQVQLPANDSPCNAVIDELKQVKCSYPIHDDSNTLKASPGSFEELRGAYNFRRQPLCI